MTLIGPNDYLGITFKDSENELDININKEFLKQRFLPFARSCIYESNIKKVKQLTKGEDVKLVYDISIDIQNHEDTFEPGDTIGVFPCNDKNEVEQLFNRLNLGHLARIPYTLFIQNTTKKKATIPAHIPINGLLEDLFLNYLDIRSIPRKTFLRSLLGYMASPEEIEKLQLLCSPKGSLVYNNFITENRTLLSLLNAFPSCQPPVERLLEHLPPLQPRPYSISCSSLLNELHITFSVVTTEWGAKGVCSGWLEGVSIDLNTQLAQLQCSTSSDVLYPSNQILFYYRKLNNFRLPLDPLLPIIMIGPGTGVAPFIGFLQHRYLLMKQRNITFGCSWLFYGCRYFERDFLYKDDILKYLKNGTLTKLFKCSSRDSTKKMYVQDLIKEHGKDFTDMIVHENAIIYVCGDAKNMAKDVQKTVVSCLVNFQQFTEEEAEEFVNKLKKSNRYIQDAWT